MAEVYFEWHPSPILIAEQIGELAKLLDDLHLPLEASVEVVGQSFLQAFESQGPGWAPWAESYAKYAETHNKGILWQSGSLAESQTNPANYLIAGNALFWTGAEAPFYWIFHHEGTVKMPQRDWIEVTEVTASELIEIFAKYIDASLHETGWNG